MKNASIDLGIDTSDQACRPTVTKPPAKVVSKQDAKPIDPLDHVYSAPAPVEEQTGLLRKCRNFLFGKTISFVIWSVVLPGLINFKLVCGVVSAICATVAAAGGYVLHKTPDTKEGHVAARVASEPKPTIASRVLEPVKEATAKPIEAVKEGAKKTVAKAEEKAEAIREEVAEQAGEVKEVIQGLKVEKPTEEKPTEEQAGFLSQAKDKLSDAKNAVTRGVISVLPKPGPPLTEKQRAYIHRKRVEAIAREKKKQNRRVLDEMERQQMAAADALAAQSNAQQQQRVNEAIQYQQNAVNQVNRQIRGYR